MTYNFHLSEQIDERTLIRALSKRRQKGLGEENSIGILVLGVLRGILVAAGGVVFAFIAFRAFGALPGIQGLYAPLLGALLGGVVLFLPERFSIKRRARRLLSSPMYKDGTEFVFSPHGLGLQSPNVTWNVSWRAVEDIIEDRAGFIFLQARSCSCFPNNF